MVLKQWYYIYFHREIINHRILWVLSHVGPQHQIILEIHVKWKIFHLDHRAFGGRQGGMLHASVLFEYFCVLGSI